MGLCDPHNVLRVVEISVKTSVEIKNPLPHMLNITGVAWLVSSQIGQKIAGDYQG